MSITTNYTCDKCEQVQPTPTVTLTLREFLRHLAECGVEANRDFAMIFTTMGLLRAMLPGIEEVIIRGEQGDCGLAAIHREGARLVLDVGQKLEEL